MRATRLSTGRTHSGKNALDATRQELAYGARITTDASSGDYFGIVVTDNDAATISNPLSPGRQQQITYEILNDSGGRMGRLRWGSEFKLAGSFTNPGDERRRTISFLYDGSSWCDIGRAGGDIG